MLLIAQPKSASTSLLFTLGKIAKLKVVQGSGSRADRKCEGFEEIQKCHSIMGEKNYLFLNNIANDRTKIYREHILPMIKHMEDLKEIKNPFIVLLRNPGDSFDSYCRMFDKNGNKWTNRKRLLEDLKIFHFNYLKISCSIKNMMIIFYRDLILNYNDVMKDILNKLGLKGRIIPLQKIKYTGIGDKRLKGDD